MQVKKDGNNDTTNHIQEICIYKITNIEYNQGVDIMKYTNILR